MCLTKAREYARVFNQTPIVFSLRLVCRVSVQVQLSRKNRTHVELGHVTFYASFVDPIIISRPPNF